MSRHACRDIYVAIHRCRCVKQDDDDVDMHVVHVYMYVTYVDMHVVHVYMYVTYVDMHVVHVYMYVTTCIS